MMDGSVVFAQGTSKNYSLPRKRIAISESTGGNGQWKLASLLPHINEQYIGS